MIVKHSQGQRRASEGSQKRNALVAAGGAEMKHPKTMPVTEAEWERNERLFYCHLGAGSGEGFLRLILTKKKLKLAKWPDEMGGQGALG